MNTPTNLHSLSKHNLSPFFNDPASSDKLPKKGIDKKLLTPCRRVGLKRKSLCSVKGIQHASDNISESSSITNTSHGSKRAYFSANSDNLSCSENDSESSLKVSKNDVLYTENIRLENVVDDSCENSCASTPLSHLSQPSYEWMKDNGREQGDFLNNSVKVKDNIKIKPDSITVAVLDSLATSVRDKRERFKHMELTNRYAKKHDLEMLKELTLRWKKGCQDALYEFQSLLSERGHNLSMATILNQFHIPFDVMQFNEDTDEFD